MPDLLFAALDIAVLLFVSALIVKRQISLVIGSLIALSLIFAPHALAALIYSEFETVNPQIVYEKLPHLRAMHNFTGAIPILALIYAGITSIRRSSVLSVEAFCYVFATIILVVPVFAGLNVLNIVFFSVLAFLITGLAVFIAISSDRQQNGLDVASLRYFVWIAMLSVAISVLEIALTRVRAATIYALPDSDNSLLIAYRASGLFNNPNWQGNWCVLLMLCCAWCAQQNRQRGWAYAGITLSTIAIYLSGSRGSLACAGLVLLVFLGLSLRHHFKQSVVTGLVVAVAAVVTDLFSIIGYVIFPNWAFAQNMFALHYRWFSQTTGLVLAAVGKIFNVTLIDAAAPAAESVLGRLNSADGSDNGLAPIMALGSTAPYAVVPITLIMVWALINIWRGNSRHLFFPIAVAASTFAVLLPMQLQAFSVFPIWVFEAAAIAAVVAMGLRSRLQARRPQPMLQTKMAS